MKKYKKKSIALIWVITNRIEKLLKYAYFKCRVQFIQIIIKKRTKYGILAVDIRNVHGLGSKLTWVLLLLAYCEEKKLKLMVRFSYPKVHQDFFQHLFLPLNCSLKDISKNKLKFTVIHSIVEIGPGAGDDRLITLKSAYKLVSKYITIQPRITKFVEWYIEEYMKTGKILGLHYRGTDKEGEAETIEYHKVKENIFFYIEKYGKPDKLFVSTDSDEFLQYILNIQLPFSVIYRETDTRSRDRKAIHLDMDSFEKVLKINEEALIDCLLLSKCSFLLKSSSFLSDWSKLFNPTIEVTILNKPHDWALWFPGKALIENNAFEPL